MAISPGTPLDHISVLSLPATPLVEALATARTQRPAEDSSAAEVGGVRKSSRCVARRKRLTLGPMRKALLPDEVEGECVLEVFA